MDEECIETIRALIGDIGPDPHESVEQPPLAAAAARHRISSMISLREQRVLDQPQPDGSSSEYELNELLARGGMGQVYSARQTSLDRLIALKMIAPDNSNLQQAREDFLSEAVVTGNLEHPNIIPIYDVAVNAAGSLFYAMKQVQGLSWKERMPHLDLMRNLDILLRVADAVSFAHDRGVIHRDIKPANVLLGEYGEVFLTDWGLAADVDGTSKAERLSREPQLCGTPMYMAPEMAAGDMLRIGKHSDIYLLGAVLYEIVTGGPPRTRQQKFWDCIQAVLRNHIEPAQQRGELLDIAHKAMATDPRDRYGDVKQFQAEIHAYRAHVDSARIKDLADVALDTAHEAGSYPVFAEAVSAYRQALVLWPENPGARTGLSAALCAYAEQALCKDEPTLALSLLDWRDPDHIALVEVCEKRIREQGRRKRSHRRQLLLLWGAAALILAMTVYLVRDYYQRFGRWTLVYAKDFTQPDVDLDDLSFHFIDLATDLPPFPCGASGMAIPSAHLVKLGDVYEPGDVRLDFWVRWPRRIDGVECMINADLYMPLRTPAIPPCYHAQFGGWLGDFCVISRRNRGVDSHINHIAPYTFSTGRVYRLSFQRVGKTLSQWVDGHMIQRNDWLMPVIGNDLGGVALRSWTAIQVMAVRVYRMARPRKPEPVMLGDVLYATGQYRAALREYHRAVKDFPRGAMAVEAATKAYLTANLLPVEPEIEALKQTLREWMTSRHPRHLLHAHMLEGDCVALWNNARYEEAFTALDKVFSIDPRARTPLLILNERDPAARPDPGVIHKLLRYIGRIDKVNFLNVSNLGIEDLSPLSGLELAWLNCNANAIRDLRPLRGMPLRKLDCDGNLLTTLDGLQGLPLTHINFSANEIEDLSPLRGLALKDVTCDRNRICDLAPIKAMPLQRLSCCNNIATNLPALRFDAMHNLNLRGNRLTHIDTLGARQLRLDYLNVSDNAIRSLEPLRGARIERIDCSGNQITDLSPLTGMPLRRLHIDDNPIKNLGSLRGLPLKELSFHRCRVSDLTPLQGMRLGVLGLEHNAVTNLTPLHGMPLHSLNINGNRVEDLGPIAQSPLRTLGLRDNRVRDLTPVPWTHLTSLDCCGNPIETFGQLERSLPFATLCADLHTWSTNTFERRMKAWRAQGANQAQRSRLRIARAVLAGDRVAAMKWASSWHGNAYLHVSLNATWHEADTLARQVGGRLVTITSAEEEAFVESICPTTVEGWLGARCGPDGQPAWITGEAFAFSIMQYPKEVEPGDALKMCPFGQWHWISSKADVWCSGLVIEWETDESVSGSMSRFHDPAYAPTQGANRPP